MPAKAPKIPKPRPADLRLAGAIADTLGPKLDLMNEQLGNVKNELGDVKAELEKHTRKLDQLVAGAVGVGRITKLEERVDALERDR